MKILKYLAFTVLYIGVLSLNAQNEAEINSELVKRNISSQSDVDKELAKRGMTAAEAQTMAKVYGIDYDDYIAKYIASATPVVNATKAEVMQKTPTVTSMTVASEDFEKRVLPFHTPNTISKDVSKYFGYNIFLNNPFASKDYLVGNIDEGYIMSPGDEVRIYVWGSHSYQAQVKIDLNGNIALPNNGLFFASGYTFKTLTEKLSNYLGKSYGGLTSTPSTAFIDVSLTQLRPVSITVLGESNTPGPHLIGGFATVLNALYASGGIKTSGSLREIKVYRNNKLIKTVDLYDYITKGSLDNDMRLMNNDVVFIPHRMSRVELVGSVRKPAIYELKPKEGLHEIISFAGGLLATASLENVALERIIPFSDRKKNEVYDKTITSINLSDLYLKKENYALYDGDKVMVRGILKKVNNKVSIKGSVNRPGTYPISKYSDLRNLITIAADSLLPKTYMNKLDIFSVDEDGSSHFKTFNLKEILSGEVTVNLQNDDVVVIYNIMDSRLKQTVKINGFVREPKTMIWYENLSLYDVLFSCSNLAELEYKSKILTSRIDIKRFNAQTGKFTLQIYDLNKIINEKTPVLLLPKDEVIVYSKDVSVVINETITINGLVKLPGKYQLLENMTVEDVILQAGGFEEFADKNIVTVSRPTFNVIEGQLSESYSITINNDYLRGLSKKDDGQPFYLKHNDDISIRLIEGYQNRKSIKISGEVVNPGTVTLKNKYQTLEEVLLMSGGLTPFASLESSYILRNKKVFIVDLKKNENKSISFLTDGDQIIISPKNGTVAVLGAVMNEGLFVWEKGKSIKKYIKESGSKSGKVSDIVMKGPNGITLKKKWYNSPKVLPNSTIYVYQKPIKKKVKGQALESFLKVLSVVTGSLTTIILVQALSN